MKYIFLFIVFSLSFSCNKKNEQPKASVKSDPVGVIENGVYMLTEQDEENKDYKSSLIRVLEIQGEDVYYTFGTGHDYRQNPDGSLRTGPHGESEFKLFSVMYKLVKNGSKIKLEFQRSSCMDSTKNPLKDMVPNGDIDYKIEANSIEFNYADKSRDRFNKVANNEHHLKQYVHYVSSCQD